MDGKLNIKVYFLDKLIFEDSIDMVVLPGIMGDIGVVSSSRELSYILSSGIIYLFTQGKVYKKLSIMGGNFIAIDNKLTINLLNKYCYWSNDEEIEKVLTKNINKYDNLLKNTTEKKDSVIYQRYLDFFSLTQKQLVLGSESTY